jgi:hypothetical protein
VDTINLRPKFNHGDAQHSMEDGAGLTLTFERMQADFRREAVEGRTAENVLLKPTVGPVFVSAESSASAHENSQLRLKNSLEIALLGLFGAPGAITRVLGGSEERVAGSNEVGAATMGVAWSMFSLPDPHPISTGPRAIHKISGGKTSTRYSGLKVIEFYTATDPPGNIYSYNSVENPGPLISIKNNPASNFFSGKYNEIILTSDIILYRGGKIGEKLGQWFTRAEPESIAKIRIDSAVKPQWIDPKSGILGGSSPIDMIYEIKIPKGTTIYEGPVGYQGGPYLGGPENMQIFVEAPWTIKGVQVISEKK